MFYGRFRAGEFVPIPVHTREAGTPYAPPAAPVAMIYDDSGAKLAAFKIPPVDKGAQTGMFCGLLRLSATYPVGLYRVAINFVANSVVKMSVGHFEVVDGGHVDGSIISSYFYQRPHASFLVHRLDSEQRLISKNPRVP